MNNWHLISVTMVKTKIKFPMQANKGQTSERWSHATGCVPNMMQERPIYDTEMVTSSL